MNRRRKNSIRAWLMSALLVAVCTLSAPVCASAQTWQDTWSQKVPESGIFSVAWNLSDFQSGRLIVEAAFPIADEAAMEVSNIYEDYYVIQYEDAATAKEAYETFSRTDGILSIQPDCLIQLEEEDIELSESGTVASGTAVKALSTEDMAWSSKAIGMDVFYNFIMEKYTELPVVKVAVLDTGIDTDLDSLEGRILSGGKNYCSVNPQKAPEDDHGHGTMVSGIIVENTLDNVQILPLKVMNKDGEGYDSNIVSGLAYAMEYGVDIINLSIGGDGEKAIYESIIKKAEKMGIAVVVAAGNEGQNVKNCTPANIDSSITISSINQNDTFSSFSNYGDQIDFCTPGDGISVKGINGQKYTVSGTSFATPYATAAFAVIKSVDYNKTGTEIYNLLKENAVDLGSSGWDAHFGYGKINLADIAAIYERSLASLGDVNEDNIVNVLDAYMILQYIVGKQEFTNVQIQLADVDRDGSVTVLDVLVILQTEVSASSVVVAD